MNVAIPMHWRRLSFYLWHASSSTCVPGSYSVPCFRARSPGSPWRTPPVYLPATFLDQTLIHETSYVTCCKFGNGKDCFFRTSSRASFEGGSFFLSVFRRHAAQGIPGPPGKVALFQSRFSYLSYSQKTTNPEARPVLSCSEKDSSFTGRPFKRQIVGRHIECRQEAF